MENNTFTLNGTQVPFTSGQTILEASKENGVRIPTLCHLKGTTPTGACRICVVEVEGARTLLPSCSTPVANGMNVQTESPRVVAARRMILDLMLSSGNHNCAAYGGGIRDWTAMQMAAIENDDNDELCPAWGDCRLQELAFQYQVKGTGANGAERKYPPMELVNPMIVRDFSRCILCGRCVQACNEVQVSRAISFGYRGKSAKIVAAGDRPLKDSDCVFCGECVQACPVGALTEKKARYEWRPWKEEKKVRSTCAYCGVGCQIHLHIQEGRIVKASGVEGVPPNFGSLCVKGRFAYDFVGSGDRLTTPLIRKNGELREVTWDEALDKIAGELGRIRAESGPDSIGVLTSARVTNEDNYIAMKFARAALQTNNVDHCARLCHASTVAGLAAAFGSGAMTNAIDDIETADVILITGSNITENHPVISAGVKRAVTRRGAKLIVIDPRRIKIAEFAHHYLRPNLGTDVAWINGMMHIIIREGLYAREFIEKRTEGFEALKEMVEKYTPEMVAATTGIPAKDLEAAARLYAGARAASIVYCMGITQHTTGTDNVKSVANLAMLCGHMGRPGTGVNPLRGQNNVQGACDMGGLPNVYTGYQKTGDPEMVKKMEAAWAATGGLPTTTGLAATEMIPKAYDGELKALYVVGENPMVSDPDLNHTEKSLKKLDFLVVQDIFLTETAREAHVVLPATCFAEKDGTFTSTERRVQRIRKAVDAPGQARGDWEILCDLSTRMGTPMAYESSEAVMEEIRSVTPSYAGIAYDRIEEEGLHWPCPDIEHPGTPILHGEQFTRGKGLFHAIDYLPPAEQVDEEYPMCLTTGRVLYQYHTGTMTMKTEGLNDRAPESFVEISREDAATYSLEDGNMVNVISRRGVIQARLKVSRKAVSGTVFIPFHFAEAAANRLTNAALDPIAKIPEYKVCAIKLSKAA
jgi:formate dehydrogenase alpha subunit